MEAVDRERFFKNEFPLPDNSPIQLQELEGLKRACLDHGMLLLTVLDERIPTELEPPSKDPSVYTGTTGIALLFWHLARIGFEADQRMNKAKKMVEEASEYTRKERVCTFLCGSSGPIALGAVISYQMNNREQMDNYIAKLKAVSLADPELPNEMLYGRAGYLYSLLFVDTHTNGKIGPELISKVANEIIARGERKGQKHLEYEWYGKVYLGAAHGHIGIMYVLLKAKEYLNPGGLEKVKNTIDWLMTNRFSSGNSKSSLGSEKDRLVHWCHGAPGAVHMYILAHKVFGDEKYLEAARKSAEVIWQRGILKRGYGICHGVAGNAYGLMEMYKHTKEPKYLRQAYSFASWCFEYGTMRERIPDRPLSLFEGRAGAIYMLFDFSTDDPKFPAFDI